MSIVFYSNPNNIFSDLYISVRNKEHRFYTLEQINKLPSIEKNNVHFKEWQLRKKSTERFINYLKNKNKALNILDIGCGNGWFSNLMSNVSMSQVVGLDVNLPELEQADIAFQKENLKFVYANIFESNDLQNKKFELIVFNSCIQYFQNLPFLFKTIKKLLSINGEIHIIDSPFYKNNTIENARQRTQLYYKTIGFLEMANKYFHHKLYDLGDYEIRYKPPSNFLRFFISDSPFYWVELK
jgi:ubiquinone/menaquinone biosynthesis C-methylase UbiE